MNGNCLSIKTHQQTHKYYSYSMLLLTFIQFSIWEVLPLSHTSILTAKTVANVRKSLVQIKHILFRTAGTAPASQTMARPLLQTI